MCWVQRSITRFKVDSVLVVFWMRNSRLVGSFLLVAGVSLLGLVYFRMQLESAEEDDKVKPAVNLPLCKY